jgi:hypothetical protein
MRLSTEQVQAIHRTTLRVLDVGARAACSTPSGYNVNVSVE